ncbi:hypothetical protein MMC17_007248 [Xylographa soralifera]|nr:hypothetical protein [Xylographa soralifera]
MLATEVVPSALVVPVSVSAVGQEAIDAARDTGSKTLNNIPLPSASPTLAATPAVLSSIGANRSQPAAARVQHSAFIENPKARIEQAVEMLCSEGTGILRDKFIDDYVKVTAIDDIVRGVLRILEPPFLNVLKASSTARPGLMVQTLPRVESGARERGAYANVVRIPEKSGFWDQAWPLLEPEGLDLGPIIPVIHVGSAAQEELGFEKRVHRQHELAEYRRKYPSFHYKAWSASITHDFVRIGKAAPDDPRALIRILEAMAVACLHTYLNADYIRTLQHFGLLEPESQVFGLNRTSAICDNIHGECMTNTSNLNLLFRNVERELISKTNIEYEGLQGH